MLTTEAYANTVLHLGSLCRRNWEPGGSQHAMCGALTAVPQQNPLVARLPSVKLPACFNHVLIDRSGQQRARDPLWPRTPERGLRTLRSGPGSEAPPAAPSLPQSPPGTGAGCRALGYQRAPSRRALIP